MKCVVGLVALLVATLAVGTAEDIVIDTFDRDGQMIWRGTQVGSTCRIEWVSSLVGSSATNWLVVTNIPVSSPIMTNSVPTELTESAFYRVAGIQSDGGTITNGLVAYYPLNGNADDYSGMGNHGTLHGPTLTSDRFGRPGRAYSFDGASYVDVTNDASLNMTNAITIAAWVKAEITAEPGYVLAKGDFNTYALSIPEWAHFPGAGKDFVALLAGIHFNAACQMATWTHVVYTYDRGVGVLCQYVDGTLREEHPYSSAIQVNDMNLQIGRRLPGQYYFDGSIDELRIYSRALSSNEVSALYMAAP